MGDSTHTMTVSGTGYTTKQVTVPADVQRDEGICIDDEVEVAIHGVSDLIDKASFTGTQTAGDRVTIPADVVRQLGLVVGDEYEFEFTKSDGEQDDGLPGGIPDSELDGADPEPDEESAGLGELFETDSEDEVEEDEAEDEGLGELFG